MKRLLFIGAQKRLLFALAMVGWATISCLPASARAWEIQTAPLDGGDTVALVADPGSEAISLRVELPMGLYSAGWRSQVGEHAWRLVVDAPNTGIRRRAADIGAQLQIGVGPHTSWLEGSASVDHLDALTTLLGFALSAPFCTIQTMKAPCISPPSGAYDLDQRVRLEWKTHMASPDFQVEQAIARALYSRRDPRRVRVERPGHVAVSTTLIDAVRSRLMALDGRRVTVVGDVDIAQASRIAHSLLPPPHPKATGSASLHPARSVPQHTSMGSMPGTSLTTLAFYTVAPAAGDTDYAAFRVADTVLGGMARGRIPQALRDLGLDQTVRISGGRARQPAPYIIRFAAPPAQVQSAQAVVRDALARLAGWGITEDERVGAIRIIQGDLRRRRQTPRGTLALWLWERHNDLPVGFLDELGSRLDQLGLAEINRFLDHFSDPKAYGRVRLDAGTTADVSSSSGTHDASATTPERQ